MMLFFLRTWTDNLHGTESGRTRYSGRWHEAAQRAQDADPVTSDASRARHKAVELAPVLVELGLTQGTTCYGGVGGTGIEPVTSSV